MRFCRLTSLYVSFHNISHQSTLWIGFALALHFCFSLLPIVFFCLISNYAFLPLNQRSELVYSSSSFLFFSTLYLFFLSYFTLCFSSSELEIWIGLLALLLILFISMSFYFIFRLISHTAFLPINQLSELAYSCALVLLLSTSFLTFLPSQSLHHLSSIKSLNGFTLSVLCFCTSRWLFHYWTPSLHQSVLYKAGDTQPGPTSFSATPFHDLPFNIKITSGTSTLRSRSRTPDTYFLSTVIKTAH